MQHFKNKHEFDKALVDLGNFLELRFGLTYEQIDECIYKPFVAPNDVPHLPLTLEACLERLAGYPDYPDSSY
jgi:hypothetical protein